MACERLVVDYLDYFLRARHVCCYRGALSAFVTKSISNSNSEKALQTTTAPIVVLFAHCLLTVCPFSCSHISSVDVLSAFQSTDVSNCKPMVHVSHVVPEGIRMGSRTRAIYLCVYTQVQIINSDNRNDCCGCAGNTEY